MGPTLDQLKKWYEAHRAQIQKDFFAFLRLPSVSADPAYREGTLKAADWLCQYLKEIGMEVELWNTVGYPIVYATHLKAGPNRPTVLIYHHYDVQPVDPLELWESAPFDPVIKNNQVYARGAADNKGQCFYSLTALKAFLQLCKKSGVNIKIFIEGEEESGSKGTSALLPHKEEALKADYLLVIDFGLPAAEIPGITLGMRGMVTMDVACQNASTDLHSGEHGGIALNPIRILSTALSRLWDEKGKIAIPGFYDAIKPLSKAEVEQIDLSFDVSKYQKTFGVRAFAQEGDFTQMQSNLLRPSLEINGISGGYSGAGFKTVLPAKASAKLSCRLVPGQDPKVVGAQIAAFIKQNVPEDVDLKISIHHGAPAYRVSLDSTIAQIAAKAYEEVFEKKCRYLLCGATVPIVTELAPISKAEAAMIGVGLATDNIHAPNEHFDLDRFEKGFLTVGRILGLLSIS